MFPTNGSSEFWNIYICILHRVQQQSKFLIQNIIYTSTSQAVKDELFPLLRPNSNLDTKSGLEWQSTRDYPKTLLSPSIFGLWSSTPSSIPNQNDCAQIINTQSGRQIRITSPSCCIGAHFLADLQTKEELLNPRFKGPVKPAFIGEVNIPGVDTPEMVWQCPTKCCPNLTWTEARKRGQDSTVARTNDDGSSRQFPGVNFNDIDEMLPQSLKIGSFSPYKLFRDMD
ncbi:hypothetical protein CISG_00844 [Coccidioides immitis RMSCC 3703]|uniref:Uncharacterized protein n=1 Tax=Coccidioides immitis RMSCC 3703 TaxID=454286 RepID=A0A0J8QS55_COCIT|nr:hypothetical protein CISG_00844 [Coccidioides immitis RMSCC 3703]